MNINPKPKAVKEVRKVFKSTTFWIGAIVWTVVYQLPEIITALSAP